MKFIKNLLFGTIAFLALTVVVSFFLPDQFTVEKSIEIDASPEIVFAQVNDIRNWDNWSFWHTLDPNWQLKPNSQLNGEGAGYAWKSTNEQLGSGNLQIIESKPFEKIVVEINFNDREEEARAYYYFEKNKEKTKVTFSMDFDVGLNPLAKFGGVLMKMGMNHAFRFGLTKLKEESEQK